jgi:CAAX prenyl protease-like protein
MVKHREVPAGVLVILAFFVPYSIGWDWPWCKFGISSLGIVVLWRWARPSSFAVDLGIRLRIADLALGSLAVLVTGVIASYVIPEVLRRNGYEAGPHSDPLWRYFAVPFQTLNEEMVLRALLLTTLAKIVNVRLGASFAVAVMFAALHFVLYWWGPPHTALCLQALTTLLLVALAFNEFFLATGSIAIPYGIHLGWNLTRFGNDWIAQGSKGRLPQGVDFNLLEGNLMVVTFAVILAVVAVAARDRRSPQIDANRSL